MMRRHRRVWLGSIAVPVVGLIVVRVTVWRTPKEALSTPPQDVVTWTRTILQGPAPDVSAVYTWPEASPGSGIPYRGLLFVADVRDDELAGLIVYGSAEPSIVTNAFSLATAWNYDIGPIAAEEPMVYAATPPTPPGIQNPEIEWTQIGYIDAATGGINAPSISQGTFRQLSNTALCFDAAISAHHGGSGGGGDPIAPGGGGGSQGDPELIEFEPIDPEPVNPPKILAVVYNGAANNGLSFNSCTPPPPGCHSSDPCVAAGGTYPTCTFTPIPDCCHDDAGVFWGEHFGYSVEVSFSTTDPDCGAVDHDEGFSLGTAGATVEFDLDCSSVCPCGGGSGAGGVGRIEAKKLQNGLEIREELTVGQGYACNFEICEWYNAGEFCAIRKFRPIGEADARVTVPFQVVGQRGANLIVTLEVASDGNLSDACMVHWVAVWDAGTGVYQVYSAGLASHVISLSPGAYVLQVGARMGVSAGDPCVAGQTPWESCEGVVAVEFEGVSMPDPVCADGQICTVDVCTGNECANPDDECDPACGGDPCSVGCGGPCQAGCDPCAVQCEPDPCGAACYDACACAPTSCACDPCQSNCPQAGDQCDEECGDPCGAGCPLAEDPCEVLCGGGPCDPECPASHCNPACPEADPCDTTCPGRECLLLCGPGACDPAVCPTAACSPLCTAINGGACNPACPTSPCEEVCGGHPCHDDCPSAACNPICDPNPCNPDCCTFDDGNPCTRDCCKAGNACVTDDLTQTCSMTFLDPTDPVRMCPDGTVVLTGVLCNTGPCDMSETFLLYPADPPDYLGDDAVLISVSPASLVLGDGECETFEVTIAADSSIPWPPFGLPEFDVKIHAAEQGTALCGPTEPCATLTKTILFGPDPQPIEVLYKTFIAPEAVDVTDWAWLFQYDYVRGDDRWFGYSAGPSRTEQQARFTLYPNPLYPTGMVGTPQQSFGASAGYDNESGLDVLPCPHCALPYGDWCFLPGATAECTATQSTGLTVTSQQPSLYHTEATFTVAANNPCGTGDPDIDATLIVELRYNCDDPDNPRTEFMLRGTHDGFPWHELYINGSLVYKHDPCATGNTPWSLFGTSDQRYDNPNPDTDEYEGGWQPVP